MVEAFSDPAIREIVFEGYRIIHRYDGVGVLILMVIHGSAR